MNLAVQFPDITEVGNLFSKGIPGESAYYGYDRTMDDALKLTEEKIETELAFAHGPHSERYSHLINGGWKLVTTALNWHKSHRGDHPIQLYIKKFPGKRPVEKLSLKRHMDNPGLHVAGKNRIFGFGCGGRLVDGIHGLKRASPKPLTLLRLNKTSWLTHSDVQWLRAMHYRQIEETSIAYYYVNGWRDYCEDFERAYWEGWDAKKTSQSYRSVKLEKLEKLDPNF